VATKPIIAIFILFEYTGSFTPQVMRVWRSHGTRSDCFMSYIYHACHDKSIKTSGTQKELDHAFYVANFNNDKRSDTRRLIMSNTAVFAANSRAEQVDIQRKDSDEAALKSPSIPIVPPLSLCIAALQRRVCYCLVALSRLPPLPSIKAQPRVITHNFSTLTCTTSTPHLTQRTEDVIRTEDSSGAR
jgi:hypothetical protein